MGYTSIRPGKKWLDTNGKPIQAHGFSVFFDSLTKTWYWYGENKEYTKKGGSIWHWGVRCYASKDLYNWDDIGLIIKPDLNDLYSPLHPTYCMDRPHIIYCEKTKKYVAWLKIMAGEVSQFMSVLQSDSFFGPYEFVRKIYKPNKMDSGDFTLIKDENGVGYIIYERPHFEMVCANLSDDYTEVIGKYSTHYENTFPPYTREAPTYFERNGKRFLFTSGTSGFFPNSSKVCIFDDFHGQWCDLGDPCVGDKTHTTFNSQITSVIKIPNKDLFIACADRWMPNPIIPRMSKAIISGIEKRYKNYKPDYSPQEIKPLPGVEQKHSENAYKSRYVWLPIEWEGDMPLIRWKKEWRIEDYI